MAHLRRVRRTLIRKAHNINSLTQQAQCMTVLSCTDPAQTAPAKEEQPWFPPTAGNPRQADLRRGVPSQSLAASGRAW
jgi:hypothetical protein